MECKLYIFLVILLMIGCTTRLAKCPNYNNNGIKNINKISKEMYIYPEYYQDTIGKHYLDSLTNVFLEKKHNRKKSKSLFPKYLYKNLNK